MDIYYQDWGSLEWELIGGLTGTFTGNKVCFDTKVFLPPSGTYKLIATFSNKCMDNISIEYYEVINGKTLFVFDTTESHLPYMNDDSITVGPAGTQH